MPMKTGVMFGGMLFLLAQAVHAQEANGAAVFNESCAACHGESAPDSRAPKPGVLRLQAAESVLQVLTTGVMRSQAARLNPSEVRAVAEFVTGKPLTTEVVDPSVGRCAAQTPMSNIDRMPRWNAAYFSTIPGWVYALDANTGQEIWKTRVEDHVSTRTTGSPVLHEGTLYVPVASFEEGMAGAATYECCTFRGSLSAIDAATGKVLWKTYTITEPLRVLKTGPDGRRVLGPSGGGIWSSPIVDAKRKAIYVATGNGFTGPMMDTTDAILALDLAIGKIRWKQQVTQDVWLPGCPRAGTGPPARGNSGRAPNVSCPAPEEVGTDVDFGSSPILATLPGGRQIIVAGQKSGDAWAFDPDRNGDIVWKFRAALTDEVPGAFGTVVWGQAVDHENMYVPLSGSADGGIRAYSSRDGSILWTFDTNPSFHTVNQVKANRGSLIGPRAVTPLTR